MSILQKLSNRFPTNVTIPTNSSELAIEGLKQIRRLTLPGKKNGELPAKWLARKYPVNTTSMPPQPKKSFNSFVSEVKTRGVAKQYNYMVEIMPPPCLVPEPTTANLIRLFCDQIMFPEMALATLTLKDAGLNREAVYDKMYGTVNASFLCDQNMIVKEFFDAWISSAVHKKNGIFQYPNRYTSYQIRIHQLNPAKKIVYTVVLNRVTLKLVNDVMLSASAKDANRFQVMFAYESWDSRAVSPTQEMSDADIKLTEYLSTKKIEDTKNTGAVLIIPSVPKVTDPTKLDSFFDFGWAQELKSFRETISSVSDTVNGVIDSVIGGITGIGNSVNDVIGAATGTSGGVINTITGSVVGSVSNTVNSTISGVTGVITSVGNGVNTILN